jgi:K+-transporting ATPase KdpF subunit
VSGFAFEYALGLVVAVLVAAYLVYALLKPERF